MLFRARGHIPPGHRDDDGNDGNDDDDDGDWVTG